ncbi:MAG: FtsX-like permease family protein [Firmicutes bacterium]|nr:FtsX-like permease family protein [Bacillota bacterium]
MLWRKMIRDLKENKLAYLACITIVVIGLMVYTSFSMVIDNLNLSQKSFYNNQNFAHGFAEVQAMPRSELEKLESLPGIKQIQGRLVKDVRVLLPNREQNVYLRLVSINPVKHAVINDVQLMRGIPLDEREMNIWIDNKFFETNNLDVNQQINIIAEGKKRSLRIVGMGRSPEFIYAMRTANQLYPDPKTFGIAFIPFETMDSMFSEQDVINNIVFNLEPKAIYKEVESDLKPKLETYGLKSIYPRKDQISHLLLTQELKGLQATAQTLPLLFLSIAGMILYIMLKRIVEQQRGQIGVLKAFGYTGREIMLHYMSYAVFIGVVGGVIGGLMGIALSYPMTSMYQHFFNMPGLSGKFSIIYIIISILLALGFSIFAGYQGCRSILTLAPAEAMKPPAPPVGKVTWLERVHFFWNMLTVQGKMAVRNISRNKGRSIFVFLGIMFTFALLALTWSMKNLSEQMLLDQYQKVETYDVKVSFAKPLDQMDAQRELQHFSGVMKVETMTEVPMTFKHKWHKKDVVVRGLTESSSLYNVLDKDDNKISPPKDGVLISERLAQLLNVEVGNELTVKSVKFKDQDDEKELRVVGVIPQYLGLNAYMEINALQDFLQQGEMITSAMLRIDESKVSKLQNEYINSDVVSGIEERAELLSKSKELLASFGSMIYILAIIAIITAFAVIYNSAIINVSERSRELASMMVLGMTPAEVLSVITFEQWFITFFAMIGGIPLTKVFLVGMAQSINNDVYTMPTNMTVISIVTAFFITLASIWIAQRMAARKIKELKLVDVLKSAE